MKNKKAQAGLIILIVGVIAVIALLAWVVFGGGIQQVVTTETAEEIAEATKVGDVASIGVFVRNVAHTNINTKVGVQIYCQDDSGTFVIDGTVSSTSAETTGKTTIGKTVTCWAFNSTYQTLEPTITKIDEEAKHIVIDSYKVNVETTAEIDYYDDTFTVADGGISNLSVGASSSDSFYKLRLKNGQTSQFLPVGGFYLDVNESTNITNIDMSGAVALRGMDHATAQLVKSSLVTGESTRRARWDYVFEFDDDAGEAGNQALILEDGDYVETSAIVVESSVGCTATSHDGTSFRTYVFTKGYFRETLNTGVSYGHETDAASASVISADSAGPEVYCA